MNEAELKRRLIAQAKTYGAYATRVEDRYRVGLLDTIIKFPFQPWVWVEGKITEGDQKFGPTPRQYEEGEKIEKAGGICALVGWDKGTKQMVVADWLPETWPSECWSDPNLREFNYAKVLRTWLQQKSTKLRA